MSVCVHENYQVNFNRKRESEKFLNQFIFFYYYFVALFVPVSYCFSGSTIKTGEQNKKKNGTKPKKTKQR